MSSRAFLDFYDTLPSVPVNQEGAGSIRHFSQRAALYRTLGLTPLMVKGRNILEVGPGSGDNALHIASWQPKAMHFIDGAKASVASVQSRIDGGCYVDNSTIEYLDVSNQELTGDYDVILCEGLIPGQQQPEVFLNNLLPALTIGGVCVITTVSSVSYLAEICRRILLPIVSKLTHSSDNQVDTLVQLFKPGLDSLTGMSRKPQDWVLDNIIHPWTDRGLFSIEDAIKALPNNFSILGSSPSFLQDWSWYKQYNEKNYSNVNSALASYQQWSGYLLDYRSEAVTKLSQPDSCLLNELCDQAMILHDQYRHSSTSDKLNEFLDILGEIKQLISDVMPSTAIAIDDFNSGLNELLAGNLQANFKSFHNWFGRGQQYLSIVRDY